MADSEAQSPSLRWAMPEPTHELQRCTLLMISNRHALDIIALKVCIYIIYLFIICYYILCNTVYTHIFSVFLKEILRIMGKLNYHYKLCIIHLSAWL
jgi:HD superfamily phosphohydrolase